MGKFGRGMGRAGLAATVSALSGIGADIRKYGEVKEAKEKESELGKIRVPIGARVTKPRAMTTPIGEAIAGREEQLISPAGGPITALTDIPSEQAAAEQQYGETQKAIQDEKDLQVQNVEEVGIMKELAPYPTAKNHLFKIAEANGWIKMVGGVPTISNKQLQLAKGIIAGDLKLQRQLNELALGDITQGIMGLKQAMLDPKKKEEEVAQIQAQLDDAIKRQSNTLNAINTMDREIQKELATREPAKPVTPKEKPHKTKTEHIGKGMYQDHERIGGEWKPFGKPYKKGEASKGWGASEWNSYRQYLKQAETSSYRDIFANDPKFKHEMAEWESGEMTQEEAKQFEARLHTALTSTQRAKLDELTEKYLAGKTPKPILVEYLAAKKRGEKHTVESDPAGIRP